MYACLQTHRQGCNYYHACTYAWTHWDLNPGPSACEADVIPLHHVPNCIDLVLWIHNTNYWGGLMVTFLSCGKLHQHSRLSFSNDVTQPQKSISWGPSMTNRNCRLSSVGTYIEHALRKRTVAGSIPTGGCLVRGMALILEVGLPKIGSAIKPALAPWRQTAGRGPSDSTATPVSSPGSRQGHASLVSGRRPVPRGAATALAADNVAAPAHAHRDTQRNSPITHAGFRPMHADPICNRSMPGVDILRTLTALKRTQWGAPPRTHARCRLRRLW